jgi:hypothetical protein
VEGLGFGRYLAGWGALLIALFLAAWLPGRSLCLWDPLEAVLGVLVAGIVDLPVYILVGLALVKRPDRFWGLWGLSVAGKFAVLGCAVVIAMLRLDRPAAFALALAAAFPIFTLHQVVRLVRAADRVEAESSEPR